MSKLIVSTVTLTLAVGLGAGYWLATTVNSDPMAQMDQTEQMARDEKPLFYRNAMNPNVTSPVPAKDSMGMDYVPVYADGASSGGAVGTVSIDPVVVQNIGVRTARVNRTSLSRTVRAVGRVDFDEETMARLHPKVEGWIEDMLVDRTGDLVNEGDALLSIYSRQLVSTQQEYLLALNNLAALEKSAFAEIRRGAEELIASSRERLRLLDVPEHQIAELEKSREVTDVVHIHTPVSGTVINIGARQGQYVTPVTELYMVVDLRQVWVYADVFEYELPWVKVGDEVEMTLASVPGKTFAGSLEYIYPYAESNTRSTQVRMVFDNPELLLRPDMFADVLIRADRKDDVIVIPSEAIIRSGGKTQVLVVSGAGKYEPRLVDLGIESNGQVIVLAGLEAGEEVVTSAQFLIDSESKLREATAKMIGSFGDEPSVEEPVPAGAHDND